MLQDLFTHPSPPSRRAPIRADLDSLLGITTKDPYRFYDYYNNAINDFTEMAMFMICRKKNSDGISFNLNSNLKFKAFITHSEKKSTINLSIGLFFGLEDLYCSTNANEKIFHNIRTDTILQPTEENMHFLPVRGISTQQPSRRFVDYHPEPNGNYQLERPSWFGIYYENFPLTVYSQKSSSLMLHIGLEWIIGHELSHYNRIDCKKKNYSPCGNSSYLNGTNNENSSRLVTLGQKSEEFIADKEATNSLLDNSFMCYLLYALESPSIFEKLANIKTSELLFRKFVLSVTAILLTFERKLWKNPALSKIKTETDENHPLPTSRILCVIVTSLNWVFKNRGELEESHFSIADIRDILISTLEDINHLSNYLLSRRDYETLDETYSSTALYYEFFISDKRHIFSDITEINYMADRILDFSLFESPNSRKLVLNKIIERKWFEEYQKIINVKT